jgi:ferrous iron transport protein B
MCWRDILGNRWRNRRGANAPQKKAALEKVALIGNPNVGKSVLFGLLTGKYAAVSNYPGTTVEISRGNISIGEKKMLLIDTPGVNSLVPMSEDEKVTRDIIISEAPSSVVHVADAKNLKRSLLVTLQIAEMGLPVTLDLNMTDEAMDKGIRIDTEKLKALLGVKIVTTIAPQRKGINDLKQAMLSPVRSTAILDYGQLIEEYIQKISIILPECPVSKRSLALMILSGDESLKDWLNSNLRDKDIAEIESLHHECSLKAPESPAYSINKKRIAAAEEISQSVITRAAASGGRIMNLIGSASMHPLYGIPVLLIALFALYEFVGVFGAGVLVDFVQHVIFAEYLNPAATSAVKALIPIPLIQELLVGQYGLITVALTYAIAIILPITVTFFIAFAILEDSGYLPRLAIMSNRAFNLIGLNGKAVLPMVLGLGCGTMAVMTARILETNRDRIITSFLLALAIPCSAQLGVILGILGSLSFMATIVWTSSIIIVLLVSGFLASKIVPGEKTEFFLEIPPIRMPNMMNVFLKTVGRVEWYLKEAVPLFMLGTFILFLLHKLDLIKALEDFTAPVVVNLLGLPPETAQSFILGFLRRDFGAAGLFDMAQQGLLTPVQAVVSLVTITLFIPCIANFFMILKERGIKTTFWIVTIVFPTAFLFGGLLNWLLRTLNVTL